ncbi:hypothetical protein [Noviherbaspirillum sp.]|uniref:hypothetical protein n=1 Tax=Noviherbaspirillum sp. TaxID=1926288 RepID=UPI002FDFEEA3
MLLEGKSAPRFDNDLLKALAVSEPGAAIDDSKNLIRIGVQNEEGDIYCIIGDDDVVECAQFILNLRADHWSVENRDPVTRLNFYAVIHPPEEILLKAQGIDPEDPGSAVWPPSI